MILTITIRMEAESKGELIDTFGSSVGQVKDHFSALREGNVFGPPNKVELRFLIVGGEWRDLPDVVTTTVPNEQNPEPDQMPDVSSRPDETQPG